MLARRLDGYSTRAAAFAGDTGIWAEAIPAAASPAPVRNLRLPASIVRAQRFTVSSVDIGRRAGRPRLFARRTARPSVFFSFGRHKIFAWPYRRSTLHSVEKSGQIG